MREFREVSVEKAILHMVAPGESGLQMSERDIPLDRSRQFGDFIAGHVLNGLQDSQTHLAHFTAPANGIGQISKDLMARQGDLVTASRLIALDLKESMGDDKRIAPGALVVAMCTAQATSFLSVMKLDPGKVFTPMWHDDKRGRYLSPRVLKNALPTLRERLQKCAFINPSAPLGDRENLLVLDRQVHGAPASFFMQGFLHAEPTYGSTELTKEFYFAVWRARNQLEKKLSPKRLTRLDAAIDGVFAGESVDVSEWLLRLPQEERDEIQAQVEMKGLDREIVFDQEVLDSKYSKGRYECDNGVVLQVSQFAFGNTVKVSPLPQAGEGEARFRITIETKNWKKTG